MMTKLSLPKQIALVFVLAFVPSTLLMGLLLVSNLSGVYRNAIFESLEAEGRTVWLQPDSASYSGAQNMASIRYDVESGVYSASDNLSDYVDSNGAERLIAKAAAQQEASGRYVNRVGGKVIFYVVLSYRGFFDVRQDGILIVLTDSSLLRRMVWTTSLELFKAFIAALLAGCAIIYGWTRLLVRDIKGIRDGIIAMSRNHYKTRLKTARRDELGELADNIEVMRRRIVENERNRQSVIQGVSHDLKTPIGVIESYAIAVKDGMCDPMEAADITLRQTKRLSDKVTKLIHLTRLGYLNIAQVKAESVRMDELVEELVAERAYQTEARIVRELEPVCFTGDDESWRIAVDNLLDNAVRYAVSLISVTLTEGRLTVFNDGKPLSEPDPAVLFNAYEKSRDGKFGLGLSIVRQTAELFGYRVSAENARGGVLFAIYRPTPEGASPVETDLSPNAVRG